MRGMEIEGTVLERTLAICAKEGQFVKISHFPGNSNDSGRFQVEGGTYVNLKHI